MSRKLFPPTRTQSEKTGLRRLDQSRRVTETPIWPESVLRMFVRPKLRPVELGWINFAVLRRSHSTLHKQRNSDLKIIADQQGHGMRTHLDKYVQSGVAERKAEAAKLYADFNGVLHKRG